jgi:hypothetical protein
MLYKQYLCNKNQQNAHFLHQCFNFFTVPSTCFEHPSVHPQEDLYMQVYGISFMLKLQYTTDMRR